MMIPEEFPYSAHEVLAGLRRKGAKDPTRGRYQLYSRRERRRARVAAREVESLFRESGRTVPPDTVQIVDSVLAQVRAALT